MSELTEVTAYKDLAQRFVRAGDAGQVKTHADAAIAALGQLGERLPPLLVRRLST